MIAIAVVSADELANGGAREAFRASYRIGRLNKRRVGGYDPERGIVVDLRRDGQLVCVNDQVRSRFAMADFAGNKCTMLAPDTLPSRSGTVLQAQRSRQESHVFPQFIESADSAYREARAAPVRVESGIFFGAVIEARQGSGVVVQDAGRGLLVAHDTHRMSRVPKIGESVEVRYRDGLAHVRGGQEAERRVTGLGR